MVEALVRNSFRTGGIVLDTSLGSGRTLIVCGRPGRRCFGLGLDPRYVDLAIQGCESFTGEKAVKQ